MVSARLSHYGHNPDIAHLRLTDKDKRMVVYKIKDGVSYQHIIDDVRDNVCIAMLVLHKGTL